MSVVNDEHNNLTHNNNLLTGNPTVMGTSMLNTKILASIRFVTLAGLSTLQITFPMLKEWITNSSKNVIA